MFNVMTYKEKLAFLRAEDIRARFVLYGRTTFSVSCHTYWTGFYWHSHRNESSLHRFDLRTR